MSDHIVVFGIIIIVVSSYCFLRLGPERCPKYKHWAWGVVKVPAGLSRMHFHCTHCGTHFDARWFLN
jgi:hypothetical protein